MECCGVRARAAEENKRRRRKSKAARYENGMKNEKHRAQTQAIEEEANIEAEKRVARKLQRNWPIKQGSLAEEAKRRRQAAAA